jgi:NADH-quinone oxidoreductase subunit N
MPILQYSTSDWNATLPLFVLAATGLAVLVFDLIVPKGVRRRVATAVALVGSIPALVLLAEQWGHPVSAFGGAFITGGFTLVFEGVVVVATIFTLSLVNALGRDDQAAGGVSLLLWGASGAMLMAGAANLMTIFLGLEILSLALYCRFARDGA